MDIEKIRKDFESVRQIPNGVYWAGYSLEYVPKTSSELDCDNSGIIQAEWDGWKSAFEFMESKETTPDIFASFVYEGEQLSGKTDAPIKRIERHDDGALEIIIDYWPRDLPVL